jgi:uncharacterized beta-barrel protein YwiB (DUF1934 family)
MKDNVNISIRSEYIGQEGSMMELSFDGRYHIKGDAHYIIYEQIDEDSNKPVKSRIKIADDAVNVVRRGQTYSNMVFLKGEEHISDYITQVGTMKMRVMPHVVDIDFKEDYIGIKLEYDLELNDQFISVCKMDIDVSSR